MSQDKEETSSVKSDKEETKSTKSDKEETNSQKSDEEEGKKKSRVCGGKYLDEIDEEDGSTDEGELTKVDGDVRLTLYEIEEMDGEEYKVLSFPDGDPENPYNWSPFRKWFSVSILCAMTLFVGLGTTAYNAGTARMIKDLNSVNEIAQLGLFTFNQACAIAPLFLAPFCEMVGRRVIYVGGYLGFALCFIGLALGKNMATIVVMRAVLGLFGSVGTILVGGTFDDMFVPEERATPLAMFAYMAILGTVAAPVYCGFIDQAIGWRWIEGIQGLSNVPILVFCLFGLKESRGSVYLHKRAKALCKETGDKWTTKEDIETPGIKTLLYNSSVKAVIMLATEPVVFFFGLWIAFAWFITFLFLSVISITFAEKKGWGEGVAGLPYIALVIGVSLAFALNFLQIRKYDNLRKEAGHSISPEHRLYGAMFGACFLPIGLFIYSFTQYEYLHWIGPCIGLACIAFGIFYIFESCYSFTSDCYGPDASSAIAGQGFMRNTLGAVAPLFGAQFFHNVGSQYAGLILAIVAVFLTFIPYVLFLYGPQIREKSDRAVKFDDDEDENEDNKDGDEDSESKDKDSSNEIETSSNNEKQ